MTTIAAVIEGRRVHMAGDSAVTGCNGDIIIQEQPKVWRSGPLLIGICGHAIWQSKLYCYTGPPKIPRGDVLKWLHSTLGAYIAAIDWGDHDSGEQIRTDCEAMIGAAGKLYILETTGAIWSLAGKYAALGSGGLVAKASLAESIGKPPKERLRKALTAAEKLTNGTRRPFRYVSI